MKDRPHDTYIKILLSDINRASDFLQSMLPQDLVAKFDFSTISSEKISFINSDLEEVMADAIFSLGLKEKNSEHCFVSILLEHKSYIDPPVPFQMGMYMMGAYLEMLRNKIPLRPVIPFLFYQGKRKWKLKSVHEYFDPIYKNFTKYIPSFETAFVDLGRIPDDKINQLAKVWLRAALFTQKYGNQPLEISKRLTDILNTLYSQTDRNFFQSTIIYIYMLTKKESVPFDMIISQLPENIKSEAMTTYEDIIEKGVKKGIKLGIEQGIEQGIEKEKIEVVLRSYDHNYSIQDIVVITGLSEAEIKEILKKASRKID